MPFGFSSWKNPFSANYSCKWYGISNREAAEIHSVGWRMRTQRGSNDQALRFDVWRRELTSQSAFPRTHCHNSAGTEDNFCDARIYSVRWCSFTWRVFFFFLVGMMRDNPVYFHHIHLGLTLPGNSHQWERTMWLGKLLLKKRCNQDLELEGATCTAKLTLKESLEGQRREDYIAAEICSEARLPSLTPAKVKNQLAAIASE